MKPCVACAEPIRQEAKLCKVCGTFQDDERFLGESVKRDQTVATAALARSGGQSAVRKQTGKGLIWAAILLGLGSIVSFFTFLPTSDSQVTACADWFVEPSPGRFEGEPIERGDMYLSYLRGLAESAPGTPVGRAFDELSDDWESWWSYTRLSLLGTEISPVEANIWNSSRERLVATEEKMIARCDAVLIND